MVFPWSPVVAIDVGGSVVVLALSFWCLSIAWSKMRRTPDDIFCHYIFSLTLSIAVFAVSRSFGHLVKQALLYSDLRSVWQDISPFSGSVNTATFIIIFAIAIYFQRSRVIHAKEEKYKHHLEEMVQERTAELEAANVSLEGEIYERMTAESRLSAEKERLAVTLRSIGDAVITTDIKGNVVLLNKVAERLTGWSLGDAVGRPINDVFRIINTTTRDEVACPVETILAAGQIRELASNITLLGRGGNEISIADSCAPILDDKSQVVGAVLVFRDITEKKKIEEQLAKVEKLETVGVLAGGIAHDFNNILQGILGNVSLAMLYDTPGSKIHENLLETEKAALRAKELTQQLLTFSKGGEPVKSTASIAEIIRDSCGFVLHGSGIACEYIIPEDLWLVDIDKGQISQVFQNLAVNAREAMASGGTIRVACENFINRDGAIPGLAGREYIKITFQDTGCGLPAATVDKVFDPFFTTKQKGSGLGLAICHSVITKHEGQIFVESEPGAGTTFILYLPAVKGGKLDRPAASKIVQDKVKGRVLVMDDEKTVRDVVSAMLQMLGYDTAVARDGLEALVLYQEAMGTDHPVDVTIMDLTIPGGMGGKDAVQEMLKLDPDARVIVSSGYSNDPIMANYRHYGFKAVINKPYEVAELRDTIAEVLGKS